MRCSRRPRGWASASACASPERVSAAMLDFSVTMSRCATTRRWFLRAGSIGLLPTLLPSLAHAQKVARIGWLSAGSEPDLFLEGFRDGLRKLGYVEGHNVLLETRHAHGDLEALRAGAAQLAQAQVALIVASLTAVRAAQAIKDIPI